MHSRFQTAIREPWARVALRRTMKTLILLVIAFVLMTGLAHAGDPTGAPRVRPPT